MSIMNDEVGNMSSNTSWRSVVNDGMFGSKFLGFLERGRFRSSLCILRNLLELIRDDLCALFFGPREDDGVYIWSPLFELARPILKS
jgi:hypothetical protein